MIFTRKIVIPANHIITLELPPDVPMGDAIITMTIQSENANAKNGLVALRGKGKGKTYMSDDFNAPLDDFAEYM